MNSIQESDNYRLESFFRIVLFFFEKILNFMGYFALLINSMLEKFFLFSILSLTNSIIDQVSNIVKIT
jgi:hypothetical protein